MADKKYIQIVLTKKQHAFIKKAAKAKRKSMTLFVKDSALPKEMWA